MANFEKYLAEFRETQQAVNSLSDNSYKLYSDYGYAAGYFGSMVADLIAQLPKAKRAEYREQMLRKAKEFENQFLLKQIKEAA